MKITRKCKDCPTWTQTVCRHAFGVYWCIKSGDGEGCRNPLDEVAEAWRKAGWAPDKDEPVLINLPIKKQSKSLNQEVFDFAVKPEPPPLTDNDY